MMSDQRAAADHVSVQLARQAQVSRGPTVRAIDREQRASDDFGEHCGSLFPECESYAEHPGNLWTSYMGRLLAGPLETAATLANHLSDLENHASPVRHDDYAAQLPEGLSQGDLFAS